jgi:hypothetical protein
VPIGDIDFAAGGWIANVAVHAFVRSRTDFADYDQQQGYIQPRESGCERELAARVEAQGAIKLITEGIVKRNVISNCSLEGRVFSWNQRSLSHCRYPDAGRQGRSMGAAWNRRAGTSDASCRQESFPPMRDYL